jgi:hypothetical protein
MRSVEHLWWHVKGGFGFSKFGRFGDLVDFSMQLVGCKMKICILIEFVWLVFWMNLFKEISYWDKKICLKCNISRYFSISKQPQNKNKFVYSLNFKEK